MEEIDRAPEQFLKVGFKTGVAKCHSEGIEDVGNAGCDHAGLGEWARIRLVLERSVSVELELLQDMFG
jgi:hypothetical protein